MIEAVIFDLDGTLVQTEKLKAISYARAAVELCPREIEESEVVEAFKDLVGRSRREVARALVERFDLEAAARARRDEFGVPEPWQAYVQVRLRYYDEMISDPETIRANRWPHTIALLETSAETGCKTALATMSHCDQTRVILDVLELNDAFDFVATRDDVERGKPDPEIYLLVMAELGVEPRSVLIIEDSPAGVQAGLAAGAEVVAIATPFSRERLRRAGTLPPDRVAKDPDGLVEIVERVHQEAR